MFGKSLNNLGNTSSHTCLNTAGDVLVKTAGRYITIFKDGKLNINDGSILNLVDSIDDIKKDGIYLIPSTNEKGEQVNAVYLRVKGNTILLSSGGGEYLSVSAKQEITKEQSLLSLSNIGLYFNTLDEAKQRGIDKGIAYILDTKKLYRVIDGEFIEFSEENTESIADASSRITESPETEQILMSILGEDYILLRDNNISLIKDVVFKNNLYGFGSKLGINGLYAYMQYGEGYLEVDNLVVRNSKDSSPKQYKTFVGTSSQNIISSASKDSNNSLSLSFVYSSSFNTGDHVLLFTSSGNKLSSEVSNVEIGNSNGSTTTKYKIKVSLASPPSVSTSVRVHYNFLDEISKVFTNSYADININPMNKEGEANTYGTSDIIDYISNITNVEVTSGDNTIYWDKSGGNEYKHVIGVVESTSPFSVSIPGSTNINVEELQGTPIYKVASASESVRVLFQNENTVYLREYIVNNGTLEYKNSTVFGDLSSVHAPDSTDSLSGHGIYTDNLHAIGGTFYKNYPKYNDSLDIPSDFDDAKYDDAIPSVGWVKALIKKLSKK